MSIFRPSLQGWQQRPIIAPPVGGLLDFADNFNRADGSPIGNGWLAIPTGGVHSAPNGIITANKIFDYSGQSGQFTGYLRPDVLLDSMSEIELTSDTGAIGVGLVARQSGIAPNYYAGYINFSVGYARLFRISGGSVTNLSANSLVGLSLGDRVRLTASGNYLKFERVRAGIPTLIGEATLPAETPITAGQSGFFWESIRGSFDNYSLTEVR